MEHGDRPTPALTGSQPKPRQRFYETAQFRRRPGWQRELGLGAFAIGALALAFLAVFMVPALVAALLSTFLSTYLAAVGGGLVFAGALATRHVWTQSTRLWRLGKLYGTEIADFPHGTHNQKKPTRRLPSD